MENLGILASWLINIIIESVPFPFKIIVPARFLNDLFSSQVMVTIPLFKPVLVDKEKNESVFDNCQEVLDSILIHFSSSSGKIKI